MSLNSLKRSKAITGILFWISLLVGFISFFMNLEQIFHVFLVVAFLMYIHYWVLYRYIRKKEHPKSKKKQEPKKNLKAKKKEIKKKKVIHKVEKKVVPEKGKKKHIGITNIVYAILFLGFLVGFILTYNLIWALLIFLTLFGYLISFVVYLITKRHKKNVNVKPEKKIVPKNKPEKPRKIGFFARLALNSRRSEGEIKKKKEFKLKYKELKEAQRKAKIEKIKEQKRLNELSKKINVEKKIREKQVRFERKAEKVDQDKSDNGTKLVEREKKRLEKLEKEKKEIMDEESKLEKINKGQSGVGSKGQAKQAVLELKGNYETDLDRLVDLVERYEKISLQEVTEIFRIDDKKAEEWARILEEHHLITIHYPAFGRPELRKRKK